MMPCSLRKPYVSPPVEEAVDVMLGDLKISVSERRLGRMMRFMDRDGDGQVSVLEFLHAIRAGEDFRELEEEVAEGRLGEWR